MSTFNKNFIRIQPPLPPTEKRKSMPVNTKIMVNNPFEQSIKWSKKEQNTNKKPDNRSRRRTRSPSYERKRRRTRSRSRNRRRSRSRSPSRSKPDARAVIRARHDDDRARGERRISNMNRIKGLERKLAHRDSENEDLRRQIKERDYKYAEMKKRAMCYKQRLMCSNNGPMNMPFFQPNMAQFMPMPMQTSFPRSVSNETIICASMSMSTAS